MKKLTIFILLFATFHIVAQHGPPRSGDRSQQSTIKGKITGTVLGPEGPVEYATVVLLSQKDQKEIDGTITDEKGRFKLTNLSMGLYQVHFSFLGYENKTIDSVALTPEKPDFKFNKISLEHMSINLDEIVVVSERALVENKIDKIVYHAEKDITSVGGDAADVLRKVPMLSVDLDGNVTLRGSSGIRVLVNGRFSSLFSDNLAEALKAMPSEQIKSVEVITSPTAKYDGEGTAGIINIITKKKSLKGFTNSLSSSIGTRTNRFNVSLSAASGRFGISANGGTWFSWPSTRTTTFFREDNIDGATRIFTQNGTSEGKSYGPRGGMSAYYDINAYNSINSSLSFRGHGGSSNGRTDVLFMDPNAGINQEYARLNDSNRFGGGFDWTTDYRRTFPDSKKEYSIAVQLSGSKSTRDFTLEQIDELGNAPELNLKEITENDGLNLETTLQFDFTQPMGSNVKLETGLKTVFRDIDSDFQSDVYDLELGQAFTDPSRTDVFNYGQNVYAAYASFNINLGEKYSVIAGSRFEQTDIAGNFDVDPATFANDYNNFLPSLIVQRKLGDFSSIKTSYTKRIRRPSLWYINPYVDRSDTRNIRYGNPDLKPELADQVELMYNTFLKGVSFNLAVYYKKETDIIESFLQIDENGTSVNTFENLGKNNAFGFNFFTSANIARVLNLRGGFNLETYDAVSTVEGLNLSRKSHSYNGNLNATLSLKKGYRVQVFGRFNSTRQTLQGFRPSHSLFSIGATKEFLNKRANIGITINQPFQKNLKFPSELSGENFIQRSEFLVPIRSFGINLGYRFGRLDFKDKKRASKIRNTDLKQGG